MHLLDAISVQQFLSPNYNYTARSQTLALSNKFLLGNDSKRWQFRRWNSSFQVPKMDRVTKFGVLQLNKKRIFVIRAVATIETNCSSTQIGKNLELGNDLGSGTGYMSEGEESEDEELNEKEKLRRMRISKANKGNTPWNKGRKHSPETLRRIRERTRIAMQSPKVKMKLVNLGHSQSKETRVKIGVGVRAGWERRRERLKLQETCYFEWQNLIAEASRRGFSGERELQWDSYNILDKELEKEWLQSVEKRKNTPRPKGNKRAPKSPEQRRKISEAISAKWADAGYRDRVVSALSKYYGTTSGEGRKPRRMPSGERTTRVGTTTKKKTKDKAENENSMASTKRRNNKPTYKDPLASSKLEMIKNIRTQRAAAELEKTQAIRQAKLLIWEAERAAKALEESATRSPLAQASLLESRELIAQAIQSLNSIEMEHMDNFYENSVNPLLDVEGDGNDEVQINHEGGGVNGLDSSNLMDLTSRFNINGFSIDDDDGNINQIGLNSSKVEFEKEEYATTFTEEQLRDQLMRLNRKRNSNEVLHNRTHVVGSSTGEEDKDKRFNSKTSSSTKKWVRGKLVEITEEETN